MAESKLLPFIQHLSLRLLFCNVCRSVISCIFPTPFLSSRSKCSCALSQWSKKLLSVVIEASAPSYKGIFSSFHCDRKWESTGPAQHLSTCHGAWVDVNCLIVPCSAPVWKHLHWLCLSTHLFRVFLLDGLIYYCKCFALHGRTKLVRYCDWSAFVYPWCSSCSAQEKRNTVADIRQKK